jgi:putative phage holliday junction resolvase
MTRHTLTIGIHKAIWLTANQRLHWSTRMRRTRMLRAYAASEARIHGLAGRRLGPSVVTVLVGYPTAGRADPTNAEPTVKAIIDGLVDARVWDDDDHTHIPRVAFERDPAKTTKGTHTVTLIIQEHETNK